MALRQDGVVRCWGSNEQGQCSVPVDLGNCVAIGAGAQHAVAVRANGTVRCWGWNNALQCNLPSDLSPAVRAVAGSTFSAALLANGGVRAWGENQYGQCDVPADLGAASGLAAGSSHLAALLRNGTVRCWGYNVSGQVNVPSWLGQVTRVAAADFGTVVIADPDCNANGIADMNEVLAGGRDCDANQVLDACQAAAGTMEDCNANGLGDACEKQLEMHLFSGRLNEVGFGFDKTWTVPQAVRAEGPVVLRLSAFGDFGGALEYVRIRLGFSFDDQALASTGDCGWPAASDSTFVLTPQQFNAAIGADGALRVVMEPSIAVDPNTCPGGTWIEASLEYVGARPADCNANGLLDSCEIAAGYSPDANGNGVVDTCESLFLPCPADFNQSATVDGADLGVLLSAWGVSGQPGVDLNSDGRIDGADLGMLLSAWGPCAR
jgi:hypothetical protein